IRLAAIAALLPFPGPPRGSRVVDRASRKGRPACARAQSRLAAVRVKGGSDGKNLASPPAGDPLPTPTASETPIIQVFGGAAGAATSVVAAFGLGRRAGRAALDGRRQAKLVGLVLEPLGLLGRLVGTVAHVVGCVVLALVIEGVGPRAQVVRAVAQLL